MITMRLEQLTTNTPYALQLGWGFSPSLALNFEWKLTKQVTR